MSSVRMGSMVAVVMLLAACGDDSSSGGSGAGGANGGGPQGGEAQGGEAQGGGGQAQGGGGQAQGGESQGGQGQGGGDCDAILTEVNAAMELAKACNPSIDVEQCTVILEGPCCPVAVNPQNTQAVADFEAAMADLTAGGCQVPCPAIPCLEDPVGLCTGEGTVGSCTEQVL
ncbi:MAG: hypothetical protein IPM79_18930 [Polyangiaceae bacterium]|jgi:hypothetical protein|nr:hypothetical protein [Polyangiaceae bacterium]MBK8939631.1 hypothetical protein [Polyangiaceae bacterium]